MKLQALAVLVAIGLSGASTGAGLAAIACWLLRVDSFILTRCAQWAGMLGSIGAVSLWMLSFGAARWRDRP